MKKQIKSQALLDYCRKRIKENRERSQAFRKHGDHFIAARYENQAWALTQLIGHILGDQVRWRLELEVFKEAPELRVLDGGKVV